MQKIPLRQGYGAQGHSVEYTSFRVLTAAAFEEAARCEACSWFSLVARMRGTFNNLSKEFVMSNSKSSELVRGAGMSATLWQKFEESIKRNNGVPDDLHVLATPDGDPYIDELTKRLVTTGAMQRNAYVVPVNYGLSHRKQIEACKFDWITDYDGRLIRKNPTEHLYPVPTGEVEQRITLVHLNRYAKRGEIIAEMDKLNVRPVLSPEFLALTKAHPDLQREFPLIGLGSVWVDSGDYRRVLYAYGHFVRVRRHLSLHWDDGEWLGYCRFPAVCPTSPRLRGVNK